MTNSNRKPILYKGEVYSAPVQKKGGGGKIDYPVSFQSAKNTILENIDIVEDKLRALPDSSRLPNEVILCVRMHPDFSAKSYYPETLFDGDSEKYGLQEIGSRLWKLDKEKPIKKKTKSNEAKMFFVRGTESSLLKFKTQLSKSESTLQKGFINDVRKLVSIDLLDETEQIVGISKDWEEGRLEAVLHPFDLDREISLQKFLDLLKLAGIASETINFKQYENGITFVSMVGNRDALSLLSGFNPLRTLHPMEFRYFVNTRSIAQAGSPKPPKFTVRPEVTIGVIDGGYVPGNTSLDPYVKICNDYVSGPVIPECASHGTQVTSAVLYGSLNGYKNSDHLPEPVVSVKNFRVISSTMKDDPDLYEIIDAIEKIIPDNPTIKVYNLSLGPRGPIYDDHISRFTFACDLLSEKMDILFCVAVGNDGEVQGYNRIQAPADMVNGLAIGAYSNVNGLITRSPYSCIGPGREGNKLKPDLSAFGGCDQNPIHLLGEISNERVLTQGTSFSSPLASAAAGKLMGYSSEDLSSLTTRALLIHGVSENGTGHTIEGGHGSLTEDIEIMASCPTQSYTLIFKGEIESAKYIQLPIPWTDEVSQGKVSFRWTSAVVTNIDPQSPDDYSTSSIEISFYPNNSMFLFKRGKQTKRIDTALISSDELTTLTNDGWECKSIFPVSESGQNPFQSENELRADFKWDTLDTRSISKKVTGVKNPMFHIHAMERGKRRNSPKVKYTLILTVTTSSAEIDIYAKVRAKYSALVPINLNLNNQINVTI